MTLTGVTIVDPLTGAERLAARRWRRARADRLHRSYTLTQADLDSAGDAGGDHDIDNTATADSNETGAGRRTTREVPLVGTTPALAIDKEVVNVTGATAMRSRRVGDKVNYTLTATNTGNVTLTGVTVVDPLTGLHISGVTLAPGASRSATPATR